MGCNKRDCDFKYKLSNGTYLRMGHEKQRSKHVIIEATRRRPSKCKEYNLFKILFHTSSLSFQKREIQWDICTMNKSEDRQAQGDKTSVKDVAQVSVSSVKISNTE